ncbi:tail fiber domain-containing protein [Janthinobacterium sp. LS2A]|uniref:tail fiber domain-containing protein n=1 Tax=Janthinobacterium sp. LS2A TaxID=3118590 RepID=UPI002F931639
MADYFYDGMPNVNERLNLLYLAFAAGPYSALPLSGGVLTGDVSSRGALSVDKQIVAAARAPRFAASAGGTPGWWRVAKFSLQPGSEAVVRISGTTGYSAIDGASNGALTTILLRVDNDSKCRGSFYTVGAVSNDTIRDVKIGLDGVVYVSTGTFFQLSVYADTNMWLSQPVEFLGAGILPPDTAIAAVRIWGLKLGAGNTFTVTTTTLETVCDYVGRHVYPAVDNSYDMGRAAVAYRTIYARTGTINTSDARLKRDFRELTTAEIAAAKDLARAISIYRWRDAVDCKGADAREHVGPTVQRAIEIMQAHGLEPFNYGFICHDSWEEQTVEHPAIDARPAVPATEAVPEVRNSFGDVVTAAVPASAGVPAIEARGAYTEVTQEAGDRYAFRYDELAMFIAAGQEARLAALEAA